MGSDGISLSELILKLDNSDWVREGWDHLAHSDGQCPFCQQSAPVTLLADLAEMYDEEYLSKQEKIEAFAEAFDTWGKSFGELLDNCIPAL